MNYNSYLQTLSNFGVMNENAELLRSLNKTDKTQDVFDIGLGVEGLRKRAESEGKSIVSGLTEKLGFGGGDGEPISIEGGLSKLSEKFLGSEITEKAKSLIKTGMEGGVEGLKEQAMKEVKSLATPMLTQAEEKISTMKKTFEPRNVISRIGNRSAESVREELENFDPEEGINMLTGFATGIPQVRELPSYAEQLINKPLPPVELEGGEGVMEEEPPIKETSFGTDVKEVQPEEATTGEEVATTGAEIAKTGGLLEDVGAGLSAVPGVGELADVALVGYSLYDLIKNRGLPSISPITSQSVPNVLTSIGASYSAGQI